VDEERLMKRSGWREVDRERSMERGGRMEIGG
jgi:hypothetical protein